jgi:hypothetical protein
MNTHTLTKHRDIQNWVNAKNGLPAIRRVPDRMGTIRARLTLNFSRHRVLTETPTQDDGISPVSWTAWLAELDRQNLALRVYDKKAPAFELIDRREIN